MGGFVRTHVANHARLIVANFRFCDALGGGKVAAIFPGRPFGSFCVFGGVWGVRVSGMLREDPSASACLWVMLIRRG